MKKRIITCICILLFLVCLMPAFNYIYNSVITNKYNTGDYSVQTDALALGGYFEPYIEPYNKGNIYYQNKNYTQAIDEYYKALECRPPKEKECSIRINIALAMIYNLGEDYSSPENIDNSIQVLEEAKAVLLEEGCATENGDGHSETAEKLKEEIEKMIESLQQQNPSTNEVDDTTKPDDKKDDTNTGKTDDIKEELLDIQTNAHNEREEYLYQYEDVDWEDYFNSDGYVW